MLSDPIADMLTRIRNASIVFKQEVVIPFSKEKEQIAKILVKEGYTSKLKINPPAGGLKLKTKKRKELVLELKYENGKPVIRKIIRISKPGLRVYSPYKKLFNVFSGFGILIISTSKGLMTNKDARKKKLGGEVICKIW